MKDTVFLFLVGAAVAFFMFVIARFIIIYGSYALKQMGLWIF